MGVVPEDDAARSQDANHLGRNRLLKSGVEHGREERELGHHVEPAIGEGKLVGAALVQVRLRHEPAGHGDPVRQQVDSGKSFRCRAEADEPGQARSAAAPDLEDVEPPEGPDPGMAEQVAERPFALLETEERAGNEGVVAIPGRRPVVAIRVGVPGAAELAVELRHVPCLCVDTDRLTLAYLGDPNSIHTRRWAGWFAAEGHRVHLLVPDGLTVDPGLHPAISVDSFRRSGNGRGPLGGVLATRRSIRERLRAIGPGILHAHYLTTAGWQGWLAGAHPFAVTVWGTDVYRNARSPGGRVQARLVLGAADLVTADSEDLAGATIAAGARPDRVQVVQFGVDTVRFAPDRDPGPLRRRLALQGRRVVFSLRAIAPLYRHLTVLEALADLPEDVVGLFSAHATREGELERLTSRAADLGLAGRIRILDGIAHDAMPDHLALADVVVSVPESDATPVSLLEAMAVGRPIVASDLPSVRALVAGYDPEALVPVGDAAATGRTIAARLAWTPERVQSMGERARAIVVATAGQDANMRVVEGLYAQLAAGRRAR